MSIPDGEDVDLMSAFTHGSATTYLPPDAPDGLPTLGVPVVVDGLNGANE